MTISIPVYQPQLTGKEKEYVVRCLDSTWISSKGEFISRFEKEFASFVGVEHATSVCNGTTALHLALETLRIGRDDEVIVPSLTYVASVNTITQTGARPVFADSLRSSWNVDPADVRRKITRRTKAVMAVHLYGQACEMDELRAICKEHGVHLVEDCAEAIGTKYKGRHVGTFGDISTFSFFGNKTITTGEGGMVVTNDRALRDRAYHLKTQSVSPEREYWHDEVGYNYRMTNICAAIGCAQLEHADQIIERKTAVAAWYARGLVDLPVELHREMPGTRHSHWMCSILVESKDGRQALRDELRKNGIETRPLFYPAHVLPAHATGETLAVAEDLSARGINLPSYPGLTEEQVGFVCERIRSFYAGTARTERAGRTARTLP